MLQDVLQAILSLAGAVAVVFLAPLAFMLIFSIVSGFNERTHEGK